MIPDFIEQTKGGAEKVNKGKLADHFRKNNELLIASDEMTGQRFVYVYDKNKGIFLMQTDSDINNKLKTLVYEYEPGLVEYNVIDSVRKDILCDEATPIDCLDADENIIVFENGVLHLDSMKRTEHSPGYYSTIQIPVKWNGEPAPTPIFDRYIESFANGDKGVEYLLLQHIGAVISNVKGAKRFKQGCALLLWGEGNTGKSVYLNFIVKLIGNRNYATIPLDKLNNRFQTAGVLGKRLIGDSDVQFVKLDNLGVFKQLTGFDTVQVEFKGKQPVNYRYNGFIILCSNTPPLFGGDKGNHIYDRFVIVNTVNSIPLERQDSDLLNKLYAEREGIVYNAVMAYKEAVDNGYRFTIPEHCERQKDLYKQHNSLAVTFFKECCLMWKSRNEIISGDKANLKSTIFNVFREWAKSENENIQAYSANRFAKEIADYLNCEPSDLVIQKEAGRYFTFRLSDAVQNEWQHICNFNPVRYGDTEAEAGASTDTDTDFFEW